MIGAQVTVPAEPSQELILTAAVDGKVQIIALDHNEVESVVLVDCQDLLRAVEMVTE